MRPRVAKLKGRAALIGVLGIAATVLVVSPAVGGPDLLTMREAKQAFFTKNQANGRFLAKRNAYSRSQADAKFLDQGEGEARFLDQGEGDARFLDQGEGDARYLGADSITQLQASPSTWVADSGPTSEVLHSTAVVDLASGVNTSARFFADVTIPSLLQGRPVSIESFELCYDAYADAVLDRVFLIHRPAVTTTDTSTGYEAIVDETDRTAYACRTYSAAAPIAFGPTDTAQVGVQVAYSNVPGALATIYRLTINLST